MAKNSYIWKVWEFRIQKLEPHYFTFRDAFRDLHFLPFIGVNFQPKYWFLRQFLLLISFNLLKLSYALDFVTKPSSIITYHFPGKEYNRWQCSSWRVSQHVHYLSSLWRLQPLHRWSQSHQPQPSPHTGIGSFKIYGRRWFLWTCQSSNWPFCQLWKR